MRSSRRGALVAHLALFLVTALLAMRAAPAAAYPWMIEHGYTGCAQCHVDPSGAGALTQYGRAQSEVLLRTHYTKDGASADPGKVKDFVFGAFKLPEALTLQGEVRSMVIPEPGNVRWILMQADLRGALEVGKFVAYGSLGTVSAGGQGAWITSNTTGFNLVSRDYWVGFKPAKGLLVRAGRMNLPFGVRTDHHILFTREATRTDTNADQQVGLDLVYGSRKVRAEIMGIAGNYQLSPDAFRERGYSGLFAYALDKTAEIGVSSLVTTAQADVDTLNPRLRQAHGVFLRYAPVNFLSLTAEGDLLVDHHGGDTPSNTLGYVAMLEADLEPTQGVHAKLGGETCAPDTSGGGAPTSATGYLAGQWFFAPHTNLRVDALYGDLHCSTVSDPQPMALLQLHFFL